MYLLLDNYDSFTYNIYQYLCELTTEEVKVVRNDAIDVAGIRALGPKAIILSPGPGRPEEAGCMIEVIRAFAGKVPILGVCLGHQAIGYAFGGTIVGAKEIVHGKVQPTTAWLLKRKAFPPSSRLRPSAPTARSWGCGTRLWPSKGCSSIPSRSPARAASVCSKTF